MEGTLITLSCVTSRENNINALPSIIKKITKEIDKEQAYKIFTSIEVKENNRIHNHILVNKKIYIDIKKEWQLGQSSITHIEAADQYHQIIKYMFY